MSNIFYWSKYPGGFWFRIFGIGLSFANREQHPALFSERNGYKKVLRFGKYAVQYLSRIPKEVPEEKPRFRVSEYDPRDCPVYDFGIEEHLNKYQTQNGIKMRLVQILPIKGREGVTVVWERELNKEDRG